MYGISRTLSSLSASSPRHTGTSRQLFPMDVCPSCFVKYEVWRRNRERVETRALQRHGRQSPPFQRKNRQTDRERPYLLTFMYLFQVTCVACSGGG